MAVKILIVDDEQSVTDFLELELGELGYEVITENSAYEALSHVMQNEVDLVLTDIAMPDMDGYQLYSRIREHDENLPVVMMTGFGYDPSHVVVKCRRDGMQDIVFKPFDIDQLDNVLKRNLDSARKE